MSDRPAESQRPAESAPNGPHTSTEESVVPFRDRDFRAVARQTAAKSRPASPATNKPVRTESVCKSPAVVTPDLVATAESFSEVKPLEENRFHKETLHTTPAAAAPNSRDLPAPGVPAQ
ncbi:MAG: hypothetical protein ABGZ35_32750, partial [Planctomycetaceae bacterium]